MTKFGAEMLEAEGEEAMSPRALLVLFRTYLQRKEGHEFDIKKIALKACGCLFISRPELMLSKTGGFGHGSADGLIKAALDKSAERGLKEQALLNLTEFLRAEESYLDTEPHMPNAWYKSVGCNSIERKIQDVSNREQQKARCENESNRSLQIINGETDNSFSNIIAQRYWDHVLRLCNDSEVDVRLKALHLTDVVLRQGLVHPMSCFPTLIALHVDPMPNIQKLAMRLLKQQFRKYRDFFNHQLTRGFELCFDFITKLHAAARRAQKARSKLDVTTNTCSALQLPQVGKPKTMRCLSRECFIFLF